ncbi:MAG: bifunctional DNA-binding transcriptional regulator/O6-methylguanine-DNA methyltransferase Ada [Planctomycetes bacterium]|nr:bifunctional DNA-binding transcriptional regulator/O6-methylguanine-DNA methyltransferase Ada [Planctomycetota bacterium]
MMTATDKRWAVVEARTPVPSLYYAVRTTGVFCRAGCPSRLPRRENVEFFDSPDAARAAGFRPCKRCRPETEAHPEIVNACRSIERAETPPGTNELASDAGLSVSAFQRLFKRVTGLTPKGYADAVRDGRVRGLLGDGASVTATAYASGFESSSRFFAKSGESLGMTPGLYRKGAPGMRIRYGTAPCRLGRVLVAATERGICSITLGDSDGELAALLKEEFHQADLRHDDDFAEIVSQVAAFVDAPAQALQLPVDIQGTAFQRRVWEELRRIPPGETRTYTELASAIGKPKAVRAVASACAANKLAVAIPCHRVKRNDGAQGGYRWGIERKQQLQDSES